jgi:hypothetical protein
MCGRRLLRPTVRCRRAVVRGQLRRPDEPLRWGQDDAISGLNTLDVGMLIKVLHRWLG